MQEIEKITKKCDNLKSEIKSVPDGMRDIRNLVWIELTILS